MQRAGKLERIWVKRFHRGRMDECSRATLIAGKGLQGNADEGGKRQVTILSRERWDEVTSNVGVPLDPATRRANVLVSGVSLSRSRGRVLRLGSCRVRVRGETRPCERMEEACRGLEDAMRVDWGGGVFAEVIEGGEIEVGAPVDWEDEGFRV